MSNTKISALPSGSPAQSTDQLPIARAGSNFSLTAADVINQPQFSMFAGLPNLKIVNAAVRTLNTSATADVYTVPANRRAIVASLFMNTVPGQPQGNVYTLRPFVKVSGTYYTLSLGSAPTITAPINTNLTTGTYIAEAGESFSFAPEAVSGHPSGTITAVAAATTTALTLSAVAAPVSGLATYTGTITGGGNNAFAGYSFVVTGFTNSANNGTFLCVASTTTTLTLVNLSSVSETHAGTATTQSFSTYTVTNTTMSNLTNAYVGLNIVITGCVDSNNNGTFLCLASTSTSLILANAAATLATTQTGAAVVQYNLSAIAQILEFDATAGLKTAKLLNPAGGLSTLYTPSGSKNGVLVSSNFIGTLGAGPQLASSANVFCVAATNGSSTGQSFYTFYCPAGNTSGALTAASAAVGGLTLYTGSIPFGGNPSAYSVTAAANASAGSTVYTGTFGQGGSNGLAGLAVTISGFANAANNGTFTISASSTTTITVNNASGVSQAGQVAMANVEPLNGQSVTISGFSNSGNNGTFPVVISTPTTLVVTNSGGVSETHAGTVSVSSGLPVFSNSLVGNTPAVVAALNTIGSVTSMIPVSNGDSLKVLVSGTLSGTYNGMIWANVLEF
ncbi:MAG: hypothetical protein C5B59_08500 [Bacteroidetes bacterium]|nr:MAG: hypothetical protein C5B59_08500 [Bacteroidota bacterium]